MAVGLTASSTLPRRFCKVGVAVGGPPLLQSVLPAPLAGPQVCSTRTARNFYMSKQSQRPDDQYRGQCHAPQADVVRLVLGVWCKAVMVGAKLVLADRFSGATLGGISGALTDEGGTSGWRSRHPGAYVSGAESKGVTVSRLQRVIFLFQ